MTCLMLFSGSEKIRWRSLEYHRIRIPEMDQHVHRFLWRNLQTHREPDVYVKTVLTFGDKPAPAMAQIALRKTAEEAKEAFPAAA